jgi:hypothetical protein
MKAVRKMTFHYRDSRILNVNFVEIGFRPLSKSLDPLQRSGKKERHTLRFGTIWLKWKTALTQLWIVIGTTLN